MDNNIQLIKYKYGDNYEIWGMIIFEQCYQTNRWFTKVNMRSDVTDNYNGLLRVCRL